MWELRAERASTVITQYVHICVTAPLSTRESTINDFHFISFCLSNRELLVRPYVCWMRVHGMRRYVKNRVFQKNKKLYRLLFRVNLLNAMWEKNAHTHTHLIFLCVGYILFSPVSCVTLHFFWCCSLFFYICYTLNTIFRVPKSMWANVAIKWYQSVLFCSASVSVSVLWHFVFSSYFSSAHLHWTHHFFFPMWGKRINLKKKRKTITVTTMSKITLRNCVELHSSSKWQT